MRYAKHARPVTGDAAHAHSIRRLVRPVLSAAVILVIAAAAVSAAATKSPAAPSPVASYEILRNFTYWGGRPQSALLEASPGVFYGTASEFDQGKGSVFRVSPDGAGGFTLTALHTFSGPDGQTPMSALVTAGDSYLYGTTVAGGEFGYGTVFKLSLDGSDFAVLHSFTGGDDGQHPMGALLADGEGFVGTTAGPDESDGGTVFRISADGTVATLHTFSGADGSHPWDALIRGTDDALYGTTRGGGTSDYGTIFRLSPDGLGGFEFNTVYEFTGSCLYPVGPLFQGGASGDLYGTATVASGGDYGGVFKVSTLGAGFTVLHAFSGFPDGEYPKGGVIQAGDGYFYGTTTYGGTTDQGSVFRMTAAGEVTIIHSFDGDHGTNPVGGVIEGSDGKLYGTTDAGGADDGTVFRVSLDPPGFELMTSFRMAVYPAAALVQGADGMLYGTTTGGDWYSDGTVFRMAADGSMFRILHSFSTSDGRVPLAALTPAGGALYGTAAWGGATDCGVVFKIQGDGTGFTVVHEFDGTDGCSPAPALVRAADGTLYGTTSIQSESVYGTIFKLTPAGEDWTFLTLHEFDGTNGAYPGGLTLGSDGKLYGTSTGGGSGVGNAGLGTVFRISTGGDFAVLHAFESGGANGSEPHALIEGESGWFYGTTTGGGSAGYGTIYKIDKDGKDFARLHSFTYEEGIGPRAGLARDAAGNFYGTTSEGGSFDFGTAFELAADQTTFTILHTFGGAPDDGASPYAGLLLSDGYLYGATMNGGWADYGAIFRIELLGGTTTPHVSASAGEAPTTFCEGGSVVLTATPWGGTAPYTFQWYRDAAAIDGATTSSTYTAEESGSYTVTVTDSAASTSDPSDPVTVTVNPLPAATISPGGPTTFSCGGSVTLSASSGSTYSWSPTGETTQSITATASGDYTVTVTDAAGCSATSDATTVTVEGPVATVSGGGAVCGRTPATIEAELGGTGPWNLTWSDGLVQNGVIDNPVTRTVSPRTETIYTLASFSDSNCAGTPGGSATVTVAAAPKAVLKGSATICPGSSTPLTVELTGKGPWTVTWSDDPGNPQVATESPYIREVDPGESTLYSIVAVSDSNCDAGTARGSARIKVSAPDAAISAKARVCAGSTGNAASVATAGKDATYWWSAGNGTITSGQGTRSIRFTAGASGQVQLQVIVTTAGGCSAENGMAVTVDTGCR